jgi:hypothetical protein
MKGSGKTTRNTARAHISILVVSSTKEAGRAALKHRKNGLKEGKGEFHYVGGIKYVGEWKNDKKCGYGTLYYKNGATFAGNIILQKEASLKIRSTEMVFLPTPRAAKSYNNSGEWTN